MLPVFSPDAASLSYLCLYNFLPCFHSTSALQLLSNLSLFPAFALSREVLFHGEEPVPKSSERRLTFCHNGKVSLGDRSVRKDIR